MRPKTERTSGGVPINTAFEISEPFPKITPEVYSSKGRIKVRGSEFVSSVSLPGDGDPGQGLPLGQCLASLNLNPTMCDGMRVARQMSVFDQFRINSLAVEYVPSCASTQAGALLAFMTNGPDDNPTLDAGNAAIRDGLSRPGAVMFNVFSNAVAHLNEPQQDWYYLRDLESPGLMVPGFFWLLCASSQLVGAQDVNVGLLWMHYDFELRSESFERPEPLAYSLGTIIFTGPSSVADGQVPSFTSPGTLFERDVVYSATVDAIRNLDGTTPVPAAYTTLSDPQGVKYVMQPGMQIWFRSWDVAPLTTVHPYVNLQDALSLDNVTYTASASTQSTLWVLRNITGCSLADPA